MTIHPCNYCAQFEQTSPFINCNCSCRCVESGFDFFVPAAKRLLRKMEKSDRFWYLDRLYEQLYPKAGLAMDEARLRVERDLAHRTEE